MLQSNMSELDDNFASEPEFDPETGAFLHTDDDENFGDLDELDEIFGPTDGFDLDQLLAESVAAKKAADETKANRKLLSSKNAKLTAAQRQAMQDQVRANELRTEWTAQASVAIYSIQQCSHCGTKHGHFSGLFQRQVHRTSKIDRWVQSNPVQNQGLHKESKENISYTEMCACCGPEFGFPITMGSV